MTKTIPRYKKSKIQYEKLLNRFNEIKMNKMSEKTVNKTSTENIHAEKARNIYELQNSILKSIQLQTQNTVFEYNEKFKNVSKKYIARQLFEKVKAKFCLDDHLKQLKTFDPLILKCLDNYQNTKFFETNPAMDIKKITESQIKPNKKITESKNKVDIEKLLDCDHSFDQKTIDLNQLDDAKNKYKNKVKLALLQKKKELLENIKSDGDKLLNNIPNDVRNGPFISFLIGMKNRFAGDHIVAKDKIDSYKKKPSITITIGEETFIIDETGINNNKVDNKNETNINFVNMVKNIYADYFVNKKNKF
ncbi:hypothetical protein COBT_000421 [Conglomerata obtusa]